MLDKDLLGRFGSWNRNKSFRRGVIKRYPLQKDLPRPDGNTQCIKCEGNDQVFPVTVEVCPQCYVKLNKQTVSNISSKVYLDKKSPHCVFCGKKGLRMYMVTGKMCQKCTVKVAEDVRERKGKRRRFRYE